MSKFLDRYIQSVSTLECPPTFHTFSCLGMLSALTGRRVWSRRGLITTYPNLYIALVGEPGCGKSVAMQCSRKILQKIQGVKLAPDCPSARKFLECAAANESKFKIGDEEFVHSPMACFIDELSTFIGMAPELMIPFLTKGYGDDYFEYATSHEGSFRVEGPAITIVACCTEDWIKEKLGSNLIKDGLSARFIWVMERQSPKRNDWPELTDEMRRISSEIAQECEKVTKLVGEFTWTEEARTEWRDWYMKYYEKQETEEGLKEYVSRKRIQVEKIAMLLTMADRNETVFRKGDFKQAVAIMDSLEENLPKVFSGIGRNELSNVGQLALDVMSSHGGAMPDMALRRKMWRHTNLRETEEILTHLISTKQLLKINKDGIISYILPRKETSNGKVDLRQEEALREESTS